MSFGASILARIERLEKLVKRALAVASSALALTPGDSTVVWRPGIPSAGNVFATWPEVAAAVAKLPGVITISVDPSIAPANIPAGNWNLRPPGVPGTVEMANGDDTQFTAFVTIENAAVTIRGLTGLTDVVIFNQSTVDLITYDATYQVSFILRANAGVYQGINTGGAAFFKIAGGIPGIYLEDFSFISTFVAGSHAIQITGAGFLILFMQDDSLIDTNQIATSAGGSVAAIYSGNGIIASQPGVAAWVVQQGSVQSGTTTLVNGVSPAIPAVIQPGTGTQIVPSLNTPNGDANTIKYAALAVDRVPGGPGVALFVIKALSAVGGGDVNIADQSTIDWELKNNPPDSP